MNTKVAYRVTTGVGQHVTLHLTKPSSTTRGSIAGAESCSKINYAHTNMLVKLLWLCSLLWWMSTVSEKCGPIEYLTRRYIQTQREKPLKSCIWSRTTSSSRTSKGPLPRRNQYFDIGPGCNPKVVHDGSRVSPLSRVVGRLAWTGLD